MNPESVREIGRCKWCGCILYGRFFMNNLESTFWEKGYEECKHYEPEYSDAERTAFYAGNNFRFIQFQ